MYKLGFLTLILCAVTSQQVICDDSGKCVASIVVCDNNCVASTVVCDNSNEIYDSNEIGGIDEIDDSNESGGIDDSDVSNEIGGIDDSDEIDEIDHSDNNCVTTTVVCVDNCVTSTIDSKATSTWDSGRESISSSGKINQVMYIFGLLPLVLL
jgi:hypothetical protein